MYKGIQKGLQNGMQKYMRNGMQNGMQKFMRNGMQNGMQKGMQNGKQKGMQNGMQKGMQNGMQRYELVCKGMSSCAKVWIEVYQLLCTIKHIDTYQSNLESQTPQHILIALES